MTLGRNVPTPATLKILETRLVEQSGPDYLVRVEADAQNLQGATVRSIYLVIITDPRIDGDDLKWRWRGLEYSVQGAQFTNDDPLVLHAYRVKHRFGEGTPTPPASVTP